MLLKVWSFQTTLILFTFLFCWIQTKGGGCLLVWDVLQDKHLDDSVGHGADEEQRNGGHQQALQQAVSGQLGNGGKLEGF